MTVVYTITPELRIKLKQPFGTLICGSYKETMNKMKEWVEKEKPPMIISVGDVVSINLHENNINPELTIVDNKSLRTQIVSDKDEVEKTVHVINPQGTITQEAITAVKLALKKNKHTHIVIEGEEDLLTLVAVLYAEENTLVLYGQPHEGIVVIKVTSDKKAQAKQFLKAMKPSKS